MMSLKGTVSQAVSNDAVLATATAETPQEAVEVRDLLERGDMVGPTEEELIVTIVEKFKDKLYNRDWNWGGRVYKCLLCTFRTFGHETPSG